MYRFLISIPVLAVSVVLAGCVAAQPVSTPKDRPSLHRRAMECLRAGIRYRHNPAVRVEAVEALEATRMREALPWIRAALIDPHPAVRFAACIAIGQQADKVAMPAVRKCARDPDRSVQVAALFALHRLGDETQSGRIPNYLLGENDVPGRRNAALILGLLDEPSGIKVLARAMHNSDVGVQHHALEAMARLGNREARQELTFLTSAGVGTDEVFAIGALAATNDRTYIDTFRYKLATAQHRETRLAAARALGSLGLDDGYDVALQALEQGGKLRQDPNDPDREQTLRIKQMAAAALGAVGRAGALPVLAALMNDNSDPRVQVSAARAILEILQAERRRSPPFATSKHGNE